MIGKHNVLNATAATILCLLEGIKIEIIKDSLSNFMGLDRRMQLLGKKDINGSQCIFVDDYGHHPTEIDKTIEAIKDSYQGFKLVMIFQPHRYTRTQDLFDEFVEVLQRVDKLYLLEIYSAGEDNIKGINSKSLKEAILLSGFESVQMWPQTQNVKELLKDIDSNSVFIFQGAGDISSLSEDLKETYL